MKNLLLLKMFAGVLALSLAAHAQIPVGGAPGTANVFGIRPASTEWSTLSLVGADTAFGTGAALLAALQTNAAAAIASQVLDFSTTNPPAQNALASWTSGGSSYLQTRATGNGATLLMATLRNNLGLDATTLRITYNLTAGGTTLAEQVASHQVYYSQSGAAGSWVSIAALTGGTAGSRSNTVALAGTWANNALLYVVWADDNATGTDNAWQLDDVVFTAGNAPVPLSVTLTAPANGALALPPTSVTMSATAIGSVPPTNVAFFTNGVLFANLTTPPYTASITLLNPVTNAIHAVAMNAGETAFSATNILRVRNEFVHYTGGTNRENFDSLGAAGTETPLGWYVGSNPTAVTMSLTAGDGSLGPNAAIDGWNYGTAAVPANRSLGTAPTGTNRNTVLRLQNNTGSNILAFEVRYDGEVWRHHTTTNEWLTNYVSLDRGVTWIATGFDFQSPVAPLASPTALDGHNAANRVAGLGGFITLPNPIPPGGLIYIRWHNYNDLSTDGALALDNFSFRATQFSTPVPGLASYFTTPRDTPLILTAENLPSGPVNAPLHILSASGGSQGGTITLATSWTNRYNGTGNNDDLAKTVLVDANGNAVVAGYSVGNVSGADYLTIKYAPNGTALWTNHFNAPANSSDYAGAAALDGGGNVFVTGLSIGSGTGFDFSTIKQASAGGALVWESRYNQLDNSYDSGLAVAVDGSGNVAVTGTTYDGTADDYVTIKYTANGTPIWTNRYSGPAGGIDQPSAVTTDASGNVVVTGFSHNGTNADYLTIKYGVSGTPMWTNRYNSVVNGDDRALGVVVAGSGDVIVTGGSASTSGPFDYYTVKYAAATGLILWEQFYTRAGNTYDYAQFLALDGAGNIAVTGVTYDGHDDDPLTVKYAPDGTPLWTNRYNGSFDGYDRPTDVVMDSTGNVFVTGYSANGFITNYVTLKYAAADGALLWEQRYEGPNQGVNEAASVAVDALGNAYVSGKSIAAGGTFDYATVKYPFQERGLRYVPAAGFSGLDTFTFTVLDALGQTYTATVGVAVVSAPAITQQPQNLVVPAGTNVAFSVTVTGYPVPSFQWRLNGFALAATNTTLALGSATTNLNGSYSVVISNSLGVVTSAVVTLSVYLPSMAFADSVSTPVNVILTNRLASLLGNDLLGFGVPTNPPLQILSASNGAQGSTTTLANAQGELRYAPPTGFAGLDTFTYTLVDAFSQISTATVSVAVVSAPFITQQPQSISVLAGSNVTLSVVALGYPIWTYQWRFNGVELVGATNATLILPGSTLGQAGGYSVVLSNSQLVVTSSTAALTFIHYNDNFANAEFITGTNVSLLRTNTGATKEAGEPDHAGNAGGKSIWFRWTAPFSGSVEWSTAGSSINTLLAAYGGTNLMDLSVIAANDNDGTNLSSRLSFNAVSNGTYFIAIDGFRVAGGFNGAGGRISLTMTLDVGYLAPSSVSRSDYWTPDGLAASILETNGTMYLGGNFSSLAKKAVSTVTLNASDSTPVEAFPEINNGVDAVTSDGEGGFFVAGRFSKVGDVTITNLVHIRADLTVDSTFTTPDFGPSGGLILGMITDEERLYIWGSFQEINGVENTILAALDRKTGALLDWDAPLYWSVDCLAVANEAVYVVVNSTNIFALDKVSGAVTPLSEAFRPGSSVFTAAILNETLYLGGQFEMAGGNARTNLAAINRLSGAVLPWNPNPDGYVLRIAATCERIYVTGAFDNIAGTFRRGLAALDPVSGVHMWPASSQYVAQSAEAFAVFQDRVFVAGQLITVNSPPKPAVFRPLISIDTATGLLSANQPAIGGRAFYVAQSGSRLLAAGVLLAKAEARYRLAALDSVTGRPLPWAPEISGIVQSLAWADNRLFVAGNFLTVDGQERKGFAAFDWPSGQLSTWNPRASITNILGFPDGQQVLVRSNLAYLSGSFTSLNGSNRQFLGAVDTSTAAVSPFDVGVSNANNGNGVPAITSMILSSNTLFVAGGFTHVGGLIRTGLAAITLNSTGTVTGWNPSPSRTNSMLNPIVSGAVLSGSSLFVSGGFDQIGGQSRKGLAEIDINSGAAMAWHPVATATTVAATLAADARAIYLAGFLTVPSYPFPVSAAAFTRDSKLTSWQPQPGFFPRVFTSEGKVILAGADNVSLYGFTVNALQVYNTEGAPNVNVEPLGYVVITNGGFLSLSVSARGRAALSYQWRHNGTNILGATNPTLFIAPAQTNHSGTYEVIVSNEFGSISSAPAEVTVSIPPTITAQPTSQSVSAGANVSLSLTAGGFPAPTFQWRLNGVNIPGANSNVFLVSTNAQATNGGSYSVVVANVGGAVISSVATVLVSSAAITLHDNLPASGFDSSAGSGLGSGNNLGATRQTGETNHAGKVGGSSVWFVWQAPANGVAKFRTRGTSFDTLLAAYTGSSVTNLTPAASDEDRAGYLTSEISFNALAGTNYAIAIDGFAAAQGNIVLAWTNDTSVTAYPRVISQPLSVTAYAGDTATFTVSVAALVPAATYQWYFGCTLISGATNASLTITNVRNSVVGNYSVRVTAGNGQSALSETASLQLGLGTQTIARDKPEDLDLDANTSSFVASGKGGPNSFVSVSAGTVSSLNYNTGGYTTQQAEPAPCAVIGGASAWVALKPTVNGVFVVDTIGSRIDTVLSVYRKTNLFYLSSGFITCDDNSAPDRLRSVVRFSANSTAEYLIVVDGVGGTDGDVTLNWRLATAPTGGGTGTSQTWLPGQTLTLMASSNAPFLFYQWLFNGGAIRFATNQTFSIAGVVLTNSGLYSVILSNFAGAVTNTVANVTVAAPVPPRVDLLREVASGTLRFRLQGSTQAQVIEVSSNLSAPSAWSPVFTNTNGPLNYLDPVTNQARRFYRTKSFP